MDRLAVGLAKELRPLPLLTTLTAVCLPLLLAHASITPIVLMFFVSMVFLLYAVHALDTFEDFFVRKEDAYKEFKFGHGASGYLTKKQLKAAASVSSIGFLFLSAWISFAAGTAFLFPIVAAFIIGVSYSRFLSKNLLTSLVAYPAGVVLAMASAYILAGGTNWPVFASLAVPVFLLLSGVKVLMDSADRATDARTKRQNIAILYGLGKAKLFSLALLLSGLTVFLSASFGLPQLVISLFLAAVFIRAYHLLPEKGIWLVAPGVYLFLVAQALLLYGFFSA